ncbi:hypothetical protein C0992_012971 [Termitomyces sp. T32_za158]|nr:hypothetical protein C0992_012971 [Termitomyces sp. T32_za158]
MEVARPTKKAKMVPLAVVGKGLTGKNIAMEDWLKTHPGGTKAAFEGYFRTLSPATSKEFDLKAKQAKKLGSAAKRAMEKLIALQAHQNT